MSSAIIANRSMGSLISSTSFGPYTLQELVNSGGMADIYLATDAEGKTCAIRRLRDHSFFNFTDKKRFWRGCEILAQISQHENIISYYNHGKIEGEPFLAMEYLEGSNLKQMLNRSDSVLQEFVGNILIDMAKGLDHVHDNGYIHLDFKPENILISRNGNVRLVDFDLARPLPDKPTKTSDHPGTPNYMAPEQLRHRPFDHRADIFAFGVTAYELLTFKKPFPGDSSKEILIRQLGKNESLPTPTEINPDIPPALERIILKCLERDMENRYPNMAVVVYDLESALYVS